jgi:hypothetical protein
MFAEIEIRQSPSIQTHRSVAVNKREKGTKHKQNRRGDKRQAIHIRLLPATNTKHIHSSLNSTKQQSVRRAALQAQQILHHIKYRKSIPALCAH